MIKVFYRFEMLYLQESEKNVLHSGILWLLYTCRCGSALGGDEYGTAGDLSGEYFTVRDSRHTIYQAEERKMMWYQKDWFTGIDYYNLKEKQIHVAEQRITKPVEQTVSRTDGNLLCKSGDADIWINGEEFHVQAGSFFCLYMHLFYRIETIRKPLHCVKVSFPYWIVYVFMF
ncbi:MAG: hypothetical protein ACLRMN_09615 [Mediterraneibacter gnavus]